MRLWSIHPKYLDRAGLTALWRESLLAKKVLQGKTKSYKSHPQLERFKKQKDPIAAINSYLKTIYGEGCRRGYCFDRRKIGKTSRKKIDVTEGQLRYEFLHLKRKLRKRNREKYKEISKIKTPLTNTVFRKKRGAVEVWEKK